MDFNGRYVIPAPTEAVWAALNDPEILKHCIPGCEQLEKTSPTDFAAVATLKIGPLKAIVQRQGRRFRISSRHSAASLRAKAKAASRASPKATPMSS